MVSMKKVSIRNTLRQMGLISHLISCGAVISLETKNYDSCLLVLWNANTHFDCLN